MGYAGTAPTLDLSQLLRLAPHLQGALLHHNQVLRHFDEFLHLWNSWSLRSSSRRGENEGKGVKGRSLNNTLINFVDASDNSAAQYQS